MTKPLALLFSDRLVPEDRLDARFEELGYRVRRVTEPDAFVSLAKEEKPLVVLVELGRRQEEGCEAISKIRAGQETTHLPILALVSGANEPLQNAARAAGATLVASNAAILDQLPQLLDHILELD
jgi:CheY-like chemotaxis protein